MAKKKVEVALQEEVETQEEWEEILQREGLMVIDIYQDWSGPCKAAAGIFRRMKTELNDDLLNFAVAKADTIDALVRYRGKCEPCFLFYGAGKLVAAVRGVNPPELEKNIVDKLKQEHEVMTGEKERVVIKDPVLLAEDLAAEEERRRKEEEEEVQQEVTLAVLKPDIVQSGRADELIEELKEKGIEILQRTTHVFTKEEAERFYEKLKGQPYYNNLVDFMTSGPSELLVCAKGAEGVIEELKGLVGPAIFEANAEEPCLRAKYATDTLRNAIHAADSKDDAAKELAFFFPEFEPPIVTVRRPRPRVEVTEDEFGEQRSSQMVSGFGEGIQRTVALLRPTAYAMYKDSILEKIKEAGFVVALQKEVTLTKEQAEEYYKEHKGQTYFGELTTMMSSGPCLALLLARQDAVDTWRKLIGPTDVHEAKSTAPESLRAQYVSEAAEDMSEGKPINLIHGSATQEEAERDIQHFFPVERTLAVVKPDAYANRDEIIELIKSAGFHVAARKDTQLDEQLAAQLYGGVKDMPFFDDLVKHMTSGRTLFMVLTREDAIAGWRKLMGPVDPDKATDEITPGTEATEANIRATYGRSVLENAVHGSSTAEQARKSIELIFGDPEVGLPAKFETQEEKVEADTEAEPSSKPPPAAEKSEVEEEGIVEEVLENTDQRLEPTPEVPREEAPKEEVESPAPLEEPEPVAEATAAEPAVEQAAEPAAEPAEEPAEAPAETPAAEPEPTAEAPTEEQNQSSSAHMRNQSRTSVKSERSSKKSSIVSSKSTIRPRVDVEDSKQIKASTRKPTVKATGSVVSVKKSAPGPSKSTPNPSKPKLSKVK